MNIVHWKDANEDNTIRLREGEVEEEATSGKTVVKKPLNSMSSSSSSSSSWIKSKDPRIVRVSRAFGGKDRHSKVCTLRGLRDRRVRLSVPTAIQLYDLQERLGLDQPSKAVDWLLDQAKEEIDELPPLPISPENFSLFNYHQSFLNLGQKLGQEPNQVGFKTASREEDNQEREENDVVFADNHHIGSYGTYHNMDHHQQQQQQQHSRVQADHNQHQLHSLVPFPSQILVSPITTSSSSATTTIQSLFPSSSSSASGSRTMETTDPRMVSHFQMQLMENSSSSSSQNISRLYSLLHGSSSNTTSNMLGLESCSRSDHHM